jgi:hypothetical protein
MPIHCRGAEDAEGPVMLCLIDELASIRQPTACLLTLFHLARRILYPKRGVSRLHNRVW